MKILWDNYLEDSTVTTSDASSLYPVSNLTDTFLLRKYQPSTQAATVTVVFPEDRTVTAVFYGYNNVVSASETLTITKGATDTFTITKGAADTWTITQEAVFRIKNSAGTTVYTGTLNVGEDVNVTYFTAVTGRSIEVDFSANDTLYVGGLAVGDPLEYEYIQVNPRISNTPRVQREVTDGGQLVAKKKKALRLWQITIPDMTNDKRIETVSMINSIGYDKCVYADLFENSTNIDPMYCSFLRIGDIRQDSNSGLYSMGITMEEKK